MNQNNILEYIIAFLIDNTRAWAQVNNILPVSAEQISEEAGPSNANANESHSINVDEEITYIGSVCKHATRKE
jgi:hypothetical protein